MTALFRSDRRMTVAAFLDWQGEPDRRYQLIDGEIVMMAPANLVHNLLIGRLVVELSIACRGRPGLKVLPETGITRPARPDRWFQADLVVTDEPITRAKYVTRPLLVIEVLSPSTEEIDRTVKLPDYRLIPAVREIVLLDQERPAAEIHRRTRDGGWVTLSAAGLDAAVHLETIPLTVSLQTLYQDLPVEEGASAPDIPV